MIDSNMWGRNKTIVWNHRNNAISNTVAVSEPHVKELLYFYLIFYLLYWYNRPFALDLGTWLAAVETQIEFRSKNKAPSPPSEINIKCVLHSRLRATYQRISNRKPFVLLERVLCSFPARKISARSKNCLK